jgi:monoamine oxidase
VEGYDRVPAVLAERIASSAELRLATAVTALRWRPGAVEVDAASDVAGAATVVRARRAIVALPLGVLRSGAVRFDPPLDERREALEALAMGSVVRLTLRFAERRWPEGMSFLFGGDDDAFPVWWTPAPLESPTITAWTGGPAAARLAGTTTDALAALAVADLATLLGRPRAELAGLLLDAHHHDWDSDPFSRGGYSYATTGARDAAQRLAEPLDDTLFIAGEATAPAGLHGTVHGAIRAGRAAARRLLALG